MNGNQTIIDVRTPVEYMGGHVPGSINIPLQELTLRVADLKAMPQPIVLCCASGMRSLQATKLLQSQGIACENGGSWINLQNN